MCAATAGQADAKQSLEHAADLAMRHAGLLVEINDGRLRIGSELDGSGAQCSGSLQGMPALHAALALSAAADVNVELALNGPTGNLDLILVVEVRFIDRAAAIGASDRQ